MDSVRTHARIAGWLYLVVVVTGPFLLLYVPGKIFVPGDASATVANILQHETLYRASIVVGLLGQIAFVLTVLALYRLLAGVSPQLAGLMVVLILIDAPLAFLSLANQTATLAFLHGDEVFSAFDSAQRDALATLLIHADRQSVLASEVLWGLWLLPLGLLVARSRFLPRLLGWWLILNGLAYVVMSAIGLLLPAHYDAAFRLATPILFGEMAFALWLALVGARPRPGDEAGGLTPAQQALR